MKSVGNWFSNSAGGFAKDHAAKSRGGGPPNGGRHNAVTLKQACSHIFSERVAEEQKTMSEGDKHIGKYWPAVAKVFDALTEEELQECEDLVEANKSGKLPEEMQRR